MFVRQYHASNEFELYGALLKDLNSEEMLSSTNRVFCFEKVESSLWKLQETFEASRNEECSAFCAPRIEKFFLAVLGAHGEEVIFYGREMNLLSRFIEGRLVPFDFEDRKPNQAVLDFERRELKESATFLKKSLQEE